MFVVLDIDECGASSPVCDINANCSNTRGSYICTCKSGYTGDGKMCQGRMKVDLPCDNNEESRFPGTCNDQQKSVIHLMQSVYIRAVQEIMPSVIRNFLGKCVYTNSLIGLALRIKTFEVCYLTAKSNAVAT